MANMKLGIDTLKIEREKNGKELQKAKQNLSRLEEQIDSAKMLVKIHKDIDDGYELAITQLEAFTPEPLPEGDA